MESKREVRFQLPKAANDNEYAPATPVELAAEAEQVPKSVAEEIGPEVATESEPKTVQAESSELSVRTAEDFSAELDLLSKDEELSGEARLEKLGALRDQVKDQITKHKDEAAGTERSFTETRARLGLPVKSMEEPQDVKDLRILSRRLRDMTEREGPKANPLAAEAAPAPGPEAQAEAAPEQEPPQESVPPRNAEASPEKAETYEDAIKGMERGLNILTAEVDARAGNWLNMPMDAFMTRDTRDAFRASAASLAEMIQRPESASPEAMVAQMRIVSESLGSMRNMKEGGAMIDDPGSLKRLQDGMQQLAKGTKELKNLYPDRPDIQQAADALFAISEKRWQHLGRLKKAVEGYLYR